MKTYEDEIKEAIKKQYGSIRKMSLVTGIPATTIYHALERGIDNTTVKTRHMILESLPFMRESILYSPRLHHLLTELLQVIGDILENES